MRLFALVAHIFNAFIGLFRAFTLDYIDPAIKVVNLLKSLSDSEELDWMAKLTDTQLDDQILAQVREILPSLVLEFTNLQNILSISDPEKRFAAFLKWVFKLPSPARKAFYLRMASMLSWKLAGSPEDKKAYYTDLLTQVRYVTIKEELPC